MASYLAVVYGSVCYLLFLISFVYAIGFLGNFAVPKAIDDGLSTDLVTGVAKNLSLLMLFAIQHSVMARQWFKRGWTKVVPKSVERSTYVLLSSLCLLLLYWLWTPIRDVVWQCEPGWQTNLAYGLFALGWIIVFYSTLVIDHFDLFGLKQVFHLVRRADYKEVEFKQPWIYKLVRHPLYLGWLFAFWSTPVMTVGHLVFSITTTPYILVAIQLEERDLMAVHGDDYRTYRTQVPMLIPFLKKKR